MRRRRTRFALSAIFFALCSAAEAQQPKIHRVGVILPGGAWHDIIGGLRDGLKQLGLHENKQFSLTIRETKGDTNATEEAARTFEREKVDLLFTTASSVTLAARRATKDISIVFSAGADPVVLGLVESFAKPGGRLTGVFYPGQRSNREASGNSERDCPEASSRSDIL
jgi:putative ABC transport system substrate-binding protein